MDNVFAECYFNDDFSNEALDKWSFVQVNSGPESWIVNNGVLAGEVTTGGSSFLLAKSSFNLSNYSFSFDFVNKSGVDQWILFRVSEDMSRYYLLNLRFLDRYWNDPEGSWEIVLWKYNSSSWYKELLRLHGPNFVNLLQNENGEIKIDVNGSNIRIYLDSVQLIDFNDVADPYLIGGVGFGNWGGSYYERSTKNLFDNVLVGDSDCKMDDVVFVPKQKIIILPGFGASWNLLQ